MKIHLVETDRRIYIYIFIYIYREREREREGLTDGRTDRYDDDNSRFSQLWERA